MEPGKAPKTSDKWLDSPVSLPGLREKFGISSGVIWGIVLSTQKGIQIFCTLEKYKKAPLSLSKSGAPPKRGYVTIFFFAIQGNSKFVEKIPEYIYNVLCILSPVPVC